MWPAKEGMFLYRQSDISQHGLFGKGLNVLKKHTRRVRNSLQTFDCPIYPTSSNRKPNSCQSPGQEHHAGSTELSGHSSSFFCPVRLPYDRMAQLGLWRISVSATFAFESVLLL